MEISLETHCGSGIFQPVRGRSFIENHTENREKGAECDSRAGTMTTSAVSICRHLAFFSWFTALCDHGHTVGWSVFCVRRAGRPVCAGNESFGVCGVNSLSATVVNLKNSVYSWNWIQKFECLKTKEWKCLRNESKKFLKEIVLKITNCFVRSIRFIDMFGTNTNNSPMIIHVETCKFTQNGNISIEIYICGKFRRAFTVNWELCATLMKSIISCDSIGIFRSFFQISSIRRSSFSLFCSIRTR